MADLGSAVGSIVLGFDSSGVDQATAALSGLQSKANALQSVGANIAGLGAAIGGPLVASVKVAADFNQELANIASVGGKAAQDSMQQISDTALQLGKDTAFSASEAASGMEELIKAGVPVQDVLDGAAASALNLSAATGTAVPESATLMATALNVFSDSMAGFNSEGEKATHIADLFAQTANASAADVHQLGFAFEQSANVAKLLGLSVDDTAASIGILSNAGLKGSDAGTSFKQMLISLVNPSAGAKKELTALGLSIDNFFGPDGTFIGVPGAFDTLRAAMENAGVPAGEVAGKLAKIFGSDAVRAAGVFFNTTDQGWTDFRANMDTAGTAADQAQTRLNTFEGALETFRGSVETLAIQVGTIFLPVLVDIVHHLTDLVNAFIAANPQIQQFVAIFGAIGAVLLTATGGALLAAGHILRLIQVLDYAGVSVKTLAASLGLLGLAIGAGILAYQTNFLGFADAVNGALSAVQEAISKFSLVFGRAFDTRRLRGLSSVGAVIGAIGRSIKQTFGINLTDQFNALGHAVDAVTASFKQALDAGFNPVAAALDALAQGFYVLGLNDVADLFDRAGVAVQDFGRIFQKFSLISQKSGMNDFASAIYAFGVALGNVTGLPVIGFFRTLADAVQTFGDTFQRASERGVNPIEAAFIALRRVLRDVVGIDLRGFTDALGNVANGIKAIGLSVARGDFAAIPGILSTIGQSLSESFSGLVISLTDWVLNVAAPTVLNFIGSASQWLIDRLNDAAPIVDNFKDWALNVAAPNVLAFLGNIGNWILDKLKGFVWTVDKFVDWTLNVGLPAAGDFIGDLSGWILDQLKKIPRVISGFKDWVLNVALPAAGEFAGDLGTWIKDKLTGLAINVQDFTSWTLGLGLPGGGGGGFSAGVPGNAPGGGTAGGVDFGAWIHDRLMSFGIEVKDFIDWTLHVGLPAAGDAIGDFGQWIHDKLDAAGIAVSNFTGWSLSIGAPAGVGGGGTQGGFRFEGWGASSGGDSIGVTIRNQLDALAITVDAFTGWSLRITAPEEGGITVDGVGIMDKIIAAIRSALTVSDAFVAQAGVLGKELGTDLGGALAAGINQALSQVISGGGGGGAAFTAAGAGPGGTSGSFGATLGKSFGDAFANFDTQFTAAFEAQLDPVFDRILAALGKWWDQKKADLLRNISDRLLVPGETPGAPGQSLGDRLGNMFGGIFVSGANAAELTPEQKQAFTDAGANIGEQMAQTMQTPEFIDAMQKAIETITPETFTGIGQAMVLKISESMNNALVASVPAATQGDLPTAGGNVAKGIMANFVNQLSASIQSVGLDIFAPIGTALAEKLSSALSEALSFGGGTQGAQLAGSGDVAAAGSGIGAALVTNLANGLAASITQAPIESFAAVGVALQTKISDVLSAAFGNAPSAAGGNFGAGGMTGAGGGAGGGIGDQIATLVSSSISGANFAAVATALQTALETPIATTMQSITTLIQAQTQVWVATFTTNLSALAIALVGAMGQIQQFMATSMQTITSVIQAQSGVWPPTITNAMAAVLSAVQTDIAGIQGVIAIGMQSITSTIEAQAATWPAAMTSAMAGATDAVSSGVAALISAMQSASSQAFDAGMAIGEGLARGMQAALTDVQAAAASLATAADAAIAKKAEIASPSRVAMRRGEDFGLGFAAGITNVSKQAGAAAAGITSQAINQLGGQMSGWADWVSSQSHNERLSLRRARQSGQLTAQHRQDLMAGGNIADFINDSSRRTPPQPVHIHLQTTLDGQALDNRIVQTAIGGMTQVPHRGGHRNSRFSLAGA